MLGLVNFFDMELEKMKALHLPHPNLAGKGSRLMAFATIQLSTRQVVWAIGITIFSFWFVTSVLGLTLVMGNSMNPMLRNHQIIHWQHVSADELRKGDIALFRDRNGDHLIKMVYAKIKQHDRAYIWVRAANDQMGGDSRDPEIGWIPQERVFGKVTWALGGISPLPKGTASIIEADSKELDMPDDGNFWEDWLPLCYTRIPLNKAHLKLESQGSGMFTRTLTLAFEGGMPPFENKAKVMVKGHLVSGKSYQKTHTATLSQTNMRFIPSTGRVRLTSTAYIDQLPLDLSEKNLTVLQ